LYECEVCCEEYDPDKEVISIQECGHSLCINCYTEYLETKLQDGPNCIEATCSNMTCKLILPDAIWRRALSFEKFKRYQDFLFKSFVEISKRAKWCPGKGCNMVVELKDNFDMSNSKMIDVHCHGCNHVFCFECTESGHQPLDCESNKMWRERTGNTDKDCETWIKLNTKNCPKCKSPINKNQGCMHMTCSKCRFEFCWICLSDYRNHGSCGLRGVNTGDLPQKNSELAMLERDMKHFDFYNTATRSIKSQWGSRRRISTTRRCR